MSAGTRHVVRLFGPAREAAGAAEIAIEVREPATVADAIAALESSYPALRALLPRSRVAINFAYVDAGTQLAPGDEIAILPPVGGG